MRVLNMDSSLWQTTQAGSSSPPLTTLLSGKTAFTSVCFGTVTCGYVSVYKTQEADEPHQ